MSAILERATQTPFGQVPLQTGAWSDAEFLSFERASDIKHELIGGLLYEMAGASKEHVVMTNNITGEVFVQLKGRQCQGMGSDMRVKIPGSTEYVYPDFLIVCDPQFLDGAFDTLLNPVVIFEVLSPSTQRRDRTLKFNALRRIESLRDYVLVSADGVDVEHRLRAPDGENWFVRDFGNREDTLVLESVGVQIALSDLYAGFEFPVETLTAPTTPSPAPTSNS